jgi:hypothetical protein
MEWFRKRVFHLGIFSIGMLLTCNVTHAQNWPRIYGDSFDALIKNISESYDRGFYLTAFTYDNQGVNEYGWIIKTDINGNILWDKKYGDGNDRNWFSNSHLTSDNGLIISGITNKYSTGDFDPLFIKTNICGEMDWCKVLICPDHNYGTDVIQTFDGSYIGLLTYYGEGETYARISLVKMDQTGEPIWIQKQAQEDTLIYNEEGANLIHASSGNYLISGSCNHPGWRPYFIFTDTLGLQKWDIIWSSAYGHVFQTIEHHPGMFYSIGFKIPPGFNNLPAIHKFDKNGNQIDEFLILADTIYQGGGRSIINIDDSTLLTGIVWSSINNNQVFKSEVIIIDTLGNLTNRRLLLFEDHAPTSMLLSSNNKILVTGTYLTDNNLDIYLWKMNSDLEDDTLYTQPLTYDSLCPYEILSDTVDLDCGVFVNIDELPTKEEYESTIKISPNPARDWITLTLPDVTANGNVELVIYNIFGQEVVRKEVAPVNRIILRDVTGFASGMYVAIIKDKHNRKLTGKFVVSR